jgi:hypothetical protein
MQALAHGPERNFPLPDANLLWWGAQLSERQAKAERSHEILEWVALSSALVSSLGLTIWLVRNWYVVQASIVWLAIATRAWVTTYSTPFYVLVVGGIVALAALILGYPTLVDE